MALTTTSTTIITDFMVGKEMMHSTLDHNILMLKEMMVLTLTLLTPLLSTQRSTTMPMMGRMTIS